MLQLKNTTPLVADIVLFPDVNGVDTLHIIAKATFDIGEKWHLAKTQLPLQVEDEYWGKPNESSIRKASDYHPAKVATDVIVDGQAYAPKGKTVSYIDVSISVAEMSKTLRIIGDRQWQADGISSPKPFSAMPIRYEYAFGGRFLRDGDVVAQNEFNPIGRGHLFPGQDYIGAMLPNIEDPANPIRQLTDQPMPVGFGPVAPGWPSRLRYAGTYDEAWQTERAPYLPENFDPRFFNCAHPDLVYPGFLRGGEPVKIVNMHPAGDLNFTLPHVNLVARVDVAGNIEEPLFNLETVIVSPAKLALSLVWKAALPCDKKTLKVSEVRIATSR